MRANAAGGLGNGLAAAVACGGLGVSEFRPRLKDTMLQTQHAHAGEAEALCSTTRILKGLSPSTSFAVSDSMVLPCFTKAAIHLAALGANVTTRVNQESLDWYHLSSIHERFQNKSDKKFNLFIAKRYFHLP